MPDLVLLHIEPGYEHARHYLLFAKRSGRGLEYASRVCAGTAAPPHPLVERALLAGCELTPARTFAGDGRTERRRLRRQGGLSRHCPICWQAGTVHR